jgi:Protein of unknown function (DUF2752)
LIRDSLTHRRHIANGAVAAMLCAFAILWLHPQSSLFPACPIHQLFGIDCPGCGATRALAALLRGHVAEALRLNALFVMLLPAALAFAFETYRRAIRTEAFRWPAPPAPALFAILAVAAIFTVARNLLA